MCLCAAFVVAIINCGHGIHKGDIKHVRNLVWIYDAELLQDIYQCGL